MKRGRRSRLTYKVSNRYEEIIRNEPQGSFLVQLMMKKA